MNGQPAVVYTGRVEGAYLREVLNSTGVIEEMSDVVDVDLGAALSDLGDIVLTVMIDEESGLPVRFAVDMAGACQSLTNALLPVLMNEVKEESEAEGIRVGMDLSLDFPALAFQCTLSQFNTIPPFAIPQRALSLDRPEIRPRPTATASPKPTPEPQIEPATAEPRIEETSIPVVEKKAEAAPAAVSGDLPPITPGSLVGKAAILTSVGQSADVDVVATLCKKIKLDVFQYSTIRAEELSDKYQVIILAVGGSNKGLGAAGIDADQELIRADALIKKAKELGMTVVAMHTGGADRRGTLSDSFIRLAFAQADIAIIVESGDGDHLMHDILAANHTPTAYAAKAADARNALKELFGL